MATILMVDDCIATLMTMAFIVRTYGYEVFATVSPEHALLMATTGRDINLLITDYTMPEMRGSELIAQVRSRRPFLPIILRTGASLSGPGLADMLILKASGPEVVLGAIAALLRIGSEAQSDETTHDRYSRDQAFKRRA